MPVQVRIGQRDLRREVALRRADVDEGLVVLPRKRARDRQVGAVADAGHRGEELLQPRRIGVERLEQAGRRRVFTSFCGCPVRSASVRWPQNG